MPPARVYSFVITTGLLIASAAAAQVSRLHFRARDPIPLAVGEDVGPQAFTLADVNKDGRLDLIAVEQDDDRFAVLLGRGDGTFEAAREYDLDCPPTAIAVADLASPFSSDAAGDVDGNPDIIVTDDDGFAYVFLGRGDGNFDPPEQELDDVLDATELIGIAIGDFDHNGRLDVAFLDAYDEVYFLCNFSGNLAPCRTDVVDTNGSGAVAIAAGNFDPDGFLDVAVLSQDSDDFSVLYGGGDGSFSADPQTFPARAEASNVPSALAAADLTGEGRDDLVIASTESFSDLTFVVARPSGQNRFGLSMYSGPLSDVVAIAVGDVDGVPGLDAVFAYHDPGGGSAGPAVLLGDGTGGFMQGINPGGVQTLGSGRAVLLADVGGNARPDIVQLAADGQSIGVAINYTAPACPGDCNGNGIVSVDDLIVGVLIALDDRDASQCLALDADGSNTVTIEELIAAVQRALEGCRP